MLQGTLGSTFCWELPFESGLSQIFEVIASAVTRMQSTNKSWSLEQVQSNHGKLKSHVGRHEMLPPNGTSHPGEDIC